METAGIIAVNKYEVLKDILAQDMEKPGLIACIHQVESDIQNTLMSQGQNEPWVPQLRGKQVQYLVCMTLEHKADLVFTV